MKLYVQLFEARNLRLPDCPCNAYARLKLGSTKCRSATCSNGSSDPCWFEDFVFNVDDLGAELQISVWHQERFADVFLGRLRLPVSSVLHADRLSISSSWYPLQKRRKRSKTPVTGEIRAGFVLSGKTSCHGTSDQSSEVCLSSSVNSTPEHSSLPRASSSESFQSLDNGQEDEVSFENTTTSEDESSQNTGPFSHFPQISAWLPGNITAFVTKQDIKELSPVAEETLLSVDSLPDKDENSVPLSFFEDDGTFEPSLQEDMPAPLAGGILLSGTYALTPKALNGIIFRPGSQFLKDLFEVQKSTDLIEGPWRTGEADRPKREISYVKAATKLVKSVRATEDQVYSRADNKGFVVNAVAATPEVPYGKTFNVEVQYCIFTRVNMTSGEKNTFFQVSWGINFLSSTMMKGIIESGVRQGLEDSFKEFEQVLLKYVSPAISQDNMQLASANIDAVAKKSGWQLAKHYFCNFRVLLVVLGSAIILLHIYLSKPCPKSGLEVWRLDFPDTLREFITSAILGAHIERVFSAVRKFLGARIYKVSDHGVKAKGNGWLLAVTLVAAKNLPPAVDTALPDPFVVFMCNGKSRTSSVKLQSYNPKWQENFEFDATEELPSTMRVEVFNFEGPFTEAESIGHAEINFLKHTSEDLSDLWVPLEGNNALAAGSKIHLRILLMNSKKADCAGQYIEKVEKEVGKRINRRSFVKNASFQRLFALPSEEFLVNDFSCSLKRKFLLQGRMFLSPRVLAFYSNIFGHKTKFMILWEDIDEIKEATPSLASMGVLLNPTILVFAKKGRAMDAYQGAKSIDAMGRLKFQFQSFIRFKAAYRTIIVLWSERTLSQEQRLGMIADIEQGEESSRGPDEQSDDSETFLGFDEALQTEVYSTELPLSVSSYVLIYEKEKLDEKVAEKTGRLNYLATPWESMGEDAVQQRRVTFKLSNQISLFGTNVTCLQQKSKQADGHAFYLDEILTLHDVPFGENFQIQVRKEMVDVSAAPPLSSCKVFVGVAWHKSTLFQNQISKNIFERYAKHTKENIDVSVKLFLQYKDSAHG